MLFSNGQFECFYKYQAFLGKGGFGSVVKATYALDGREYAVKIAKLGENTSPIAAKEEALHFADMNHENVCTPNDNSQYHMKKGFSFCLFVYYHKAYYLR